jgi:hypothetical protein
MGLDLNGTMVSVDGFELRGAIVPDAHLTSLMGSRPDSSFPLAAPGSPAQEEK